jgi:hypothetical protein
MIDDPLMDPVWLDNYHPGPTLNPAQVKFVEAFFREFDTSDPCEFDTSDPCDEWDILGVWVHYYRQIENWTPHPCYVHRYCAGGRFVNISEYCK